MIEVERKFRTSPADTDRIRATVAGEWSTTEQIDLVYLRPGKSFASLREGDVIVRLRQQDGRTSLSVKSKSTGDHNVEHETSVGDPFAMTGALDLMGWVAVSDIRKTRSSSTLDGVKIELDLVEGLGMFVELEVLAHDETEIDAALRQIDLVRDHLGIPAEAQESRKYDTLLAERAEAG